MTRDDLTLMVVTTYSQLQPSVSQIDPATIALIVEAIIAIVRFCVERHKNDPDRIARIVRERPAWARSVIRRHSGLGDASIETIYTLASECEAADFLAASKIK